MKQDRQNKPSFPQLNQGASNIDYAVLVLKHISSCHSTDLEQLSLKLKKANILYTKKRTF